MPDKLPVWKEKVQINPWYGGKKYRQTPAMEGKSTDKPPLFNPNCLSPACGPNLMARGSISALRIAATRPFLLYLSSYLCWERCVVCVWFCIHNHLFVLFLLFLRIQYISLARCSCYMLDPAHISVLLFYLHVFYSNFCVCVCKHVYAISSSCMFVHMYRHFHMYCLCYILYW